MNNTQLEEESRFNALVATLWQRHDERLTRSPSTSMSAPAVGFNYSSRRGQLASTAGCSTGQIRTHAWDGQEVVLFLPHQQNYQTSICIYRSGGACSPHSKKVLGSIPICLCVGGLFHFPPTVQKKHISLTEDSKSGVSQCGVSWDGPVTHPGWSCRDRCLTRTKKHLGFLE